MLQIWARFVMVLLHCDDCCYVRVTPVAVHLRYTGLCCGKVMMSAGTNTVLKKLWCSSANLRVDYERVCVQRYGRVIVEVYQCPQCNTLMFFYPAERKGRYDTVRPRAPRWSYAQ